MSTTTTRTRRLVWVAWALVSATFVVLCFVLGYTEAGYVTLVTALVAPLAGRLGTYLALRGSRDPD